MTARIGPAGPEKLLASMAKASISPSALVTYPDSARTFDIDPVFA